MNKILITFVLFALIATSCVALNKKKKHAQKVFAQDDSDPRNYSLQKLLDFQIPDSIQCSQAQQYEDVAKRMNQFVGFFNNNPVQKLDDSINALSEASILLKKAKSLVEKDLNQFGFLQKKTKTLLIQKLKLNPNEKVQSLLGGVENIVNPDLFAQIQSQYSSYNQQQSDQQIVEKLQQVIDMIKTLNQEQTALKDDSQNFDGYSSQLQEKIQQANNAIATCV